MRLFFKTIPRPLNILVTLSLLLLFLKVFVLNSIPEIFNGAHELGLIVEAILASIIASYFFYLIVIHFKEVKNKKAINPHIRKWTKQIIGNCKQQIQDISEESGIDLDFKSSTEQDIKHALKRIDSNKDAPLIINKNLSHANWIQYLGYFKDKTQEYISKINSQLMFLDADLIAILSKIDDCTYFMFVKTINAHRNYNIRLGDISELFFNYCKYCRKLQSYLENELILESKD